MGNTESNRIESAITLIREKIKAIKKSEDINRAGMLKSSATLKVRSYLHDKVCGFVKQREHLEDVLATLEG